MLRGEVDTADNNFWRWDEPGDPAPWYFRARWSVINGVRECVSLEIWHGATQGVGADGDLFPAQWQSETGPPQPITNTTIKRLPLGQILNGRRQVLADAVRKQQVTEPSTEPDPGMWRMDPEPDALDRRMAEFQANLGAEQRAIWADPVTQPKGRPAKYGQAHWENVARVYREALAAGTRPNVAIADHFAVPLTTARKWSARCRTEFQTLGSTRPGRAGES